ncbi:MAG: hypothetical protein COB20_15810 [SAR86 cluster bacterium]|uniref:Uncharacterized protein n=1 Tax=SAR86 cluster bacterium TaxID=2030880 RepID=A0A2A4WUV3_9GAMM|nr:MAG: hypothetical protein COB20_15810 [SAR86 cluster bacterium]
METTANTLQPQASPRLLSSLIALLFMMLGQAVQAAEESCESFPNAGSDGDLLVALVVSASDDSLLQLNLDDNEVCTLNRTSTDLSDLASTSFHINTTLDEFTVQVTVEDFDTWLRINFKV